MDMVKPSGIFYRFIIFLFLLGFLLPYPAAISQEEGSEDSGESDYIIEIEAHFGLVEDPEVVGRVERIRDRLAAVIPEYENDNRELIVRVLDDDAINAFALPDAHVYFFKGLIDACATDDMLAGVMAHEFTHVYHRHHSRMGDRQLRGMLIGLGAMLATGEMEALMAGQMIAASMVETYGRSAENDADATGSRWMVAAGYDPVAYLELMGILEQQSIHRPEPGGNYFTVHPHPDERIANIRAVLEELGYDVPDEIYRIHIPLRFYLPLSESEASRLEDWEESLLNRAGGVENESDSEVDELPVSLVTEYQLRIALFEGIDPPYEGVYGVIAAGDDAVFYITAETSEELTGRGDEINSRLGELFWGGLKNWEVSGRNPDTSDPVLIARRRTIAYVTESDAELLGMTREEVNDNRVEVLKDILYRYYVDRRI